MEVMALRLTGERGPYRNPDTRGWGTDPEPERERSGDEARASPRGRRPAAFTGEEGGDSSVPDSAWIVTDGVTVVTGTDEEDAAPAYDVGVSAVGTVLSLLDRLEEPGLREGL